jgi:hypothetical protein
MKKRNKKKKRINWEIEANWPHPNPLQGEGDWKIGILGLCFIGPHPNPLPKERETGRLKRRWIILDGVILASPQPSPRKRGLGD